MSTTTTDSGIYIARQPIHTTEDAVHGYAILYRTGSMNAMLCDEAEAAERIARQVAENFDLSALSSEHPAFLSVSTDIPRTDDYKLLDHENTIYELIPSENSTVELAESIRLLNADNYDTAARVRDIKPADTDVIEQVNYITLSMDEPITDDIKTIIKHGRKAGAHVVAKEVRTHEQHQEALALGCSMFQGYYFSKPKMIEKREITADEASRLQLIDQLSRPSVSMDDLEAIIKRDAGLAITLLKRINSAGMGVREKIESIKQAIVMCGLKTLRQWVAAMVFAKLCKGKPNELMKMGVARAFFCEAIARKMDPAAAKELNYYLTGLFSCMDAVLECDMENILLQVNLPDEVVTALTGGDNIYAECLALAAAQEDGDWTRITELSEKYEIDSGALAKTLTDSIKMADAAT